MTETVQALEILPIDLAPWCAGNVGVDHVHRFDSGRPGPDVLVAALTHGNELSGAYALDWLLRQSPVPLRGRLTVAFMNVAAYQSFDPANPTVSRFLDEDLNRLWTPEQLDGPRVTRELTRARALRPYVEGADLLLDLHSMQLDSPPLTLCGTTPQGRELALGVGVPSWIVADPGHDAGRRMRDHGGFGIAGSGKAALLAECGQHWRRATVAVAIETLVRFLRATGTLPADFAPQRANGAPPPATVVEVDGPVTIQTDRFSFTETWHGMEIVPTAGTLIGHDGDRPVLTPFDDCVLIMPSRRLVRGQTAVRLGRIVR